MDASLFAPFGNVFVGALVMGAGFIGGLIRGYSGFGFALAAVPILSLALVPALAVPSVLIHELAIGLLTLRAERGSVAWSVLGTLAAGSLIGSPIGLAFLRSVPADYMRLIVCLVMAVCVAIIWRSPHAPFQLRRERVFLAGIASGLLNGGTAMSGPPAVIVLLGSSLPPRDVRSVLVFFIVFSAAIGVLFSLLGGMQGIETARIALWMAPGVILGVPVGMYLFGIVPSAHYRRISLVFLIVVSSVSLASSILALS